MAPSRGVSIAWLRRDLRLHDQPALAAAAASAGPSGQLAVVYVLDPGLLRGRWSSSNRTWFLLESLRTLDADLLALGSRLDVRIGDPTDVVPTLAAVIGATTVHVSADPSPYARRRDSAVRVALARRGAVLEEHPGLMVHGPDDLLTRDGRPYTVFSPYRRSWDAGLRRSPIPAPGALPGPAGSISAASIPALADLGLPPPSGDTSAFPEPGETAARRRLARWLDAGIGAYAESRHRLDGDGTSRISQDLRFGLLSPLEIADLAGAGEGGPGTAAWLAELCWRDFYLQLLAHHPRVLREPFRAAFGGFPWAIDPTGLAAWRAGRTGYPVVDAAMRQLERNAFMPNRARMIVASFLAKHLRIDWREGETHFMRHLVDGEPAANDGGWQWTASTGTDAQPWFRVFDPVSQGQRFDPHGTYVRRWVPELAEVPDAHIHTPWTMSPDAQAESGCRIGIDYPAPIVDHREARAAWFAALDAAGIRPSSR